MSFNLTTSGACIAKAGKGANVMFSQLSGATILANWCDQAEADLNAITRRDWISLSGSTLTNFKGILDDLTSDMVAMKIVNYDMGGYTSRLEGATILDVMRDNINRNLEALKNDNIKEVMIV